MNTQTVKTIDVNAMEWFDKVNGNSYFAGNVTTNYGMEDEQIYFMPFQYGYGSQYEQEAKTLLIKHKVLPDIGFTALSSYCRENGIIYRGTKVGNCKKAELTRITKLIEQGGVLS